jgi:transcriptional regulator with XRE-family HTH domain
MRTESSTVKKVGERLKSIRSDNRLTQAEVADAAGISTNYYARIERGDTGISMEIFEKVVKALKVKSSDILPF